MDTLLREKVLYDGWMGSWLSGRVWGMEEECDEW